jgi:hypothetical protein
LSAHFPEIPSHLNTPTESNHKGLSPMKLAVMKILPEIGWYRGSTEFSSRKYREENDTGNCSDEAWHHLFETRLISFQVHISLREGQIHISD